MVRPFFSAENGLVNLGYGRGVYGHKAKKEILLSIK